MVSQIVAHLLSGRVVKGESFDVDPTKPRCHVKTRSGVEEVKLAEVKALFFVRNLEGDPARTDSQETDASDSRLRGTTQVEIHFKDGERIVGLTNRYPPRGQFFFIVPVDPASNNSRILINQAAVAAAEAVSSGAGVRTA